MEVPIRFLLLILLTLQSTSGLTATLQSTSGLTAAPNTQKELLRRSTSFSWKNELEEESMPSNDLMSRSDERSLRWSWSNLFFCLGPKKCHHHSSSSSGGGGDGSGDGSDGSGSSTSSSRSGSQENMDVSTSGGLLSALASAGVVASLTILFFMVVAMSGYGVAMAVAYVAHRRERAMQYEDGSEGYEDAESGTKRPGEPVKGAVARRLETLAAGGKVVPLDMSGAPRFMGLADLAAAFPNNKRKIREGSDTDTSSDEGSDDLMYRELQENIEISSKASSLRAGTDNTATKLEEKSLPQSSDEYLELSDDGVMTNATAQIVATESSSKTAAVTAALSVAMETGNNDESSTMEEDENVEIQAAPSSTPTENGDYVEMKEPSSNKTNPVLVHKQK